MPASIDATQEAEVDHACPGQSESQDSQHILDAYMRQYGNNDIVVGGKPICIGSFPPRTDFLSKRKRLRWLTLKYLSR